MPIEVSTGTVEVLGWFNWVRASLAAIDIVVAGVVADLVNTMSSILSSLPLWGDDHIFCETWS